MPSCCAPQYVWQLPPYLTKSSTTTAQSRWGDVMAVRPSQTSFWQSSVLTSTHTLGSHSRVVVGSGASSLRAGSPGGDQSHVGRNATSAMPRYSGIMSFSPNQSRTNDAVAASTSKQSESRIVALMVSVATSATSSRGGGRPSRSARTTSSSARY